MNKNNFNFKTIISVLNRYFFNFRTLIVFSILMIYPLLAANGYMIVTFNAISRIIILLILTYLPIFIKYTIYESLIFFFYKKFEHDKNNFIFKNFKFLYDLYNKDSNYFCNIISNLLMYFLFFIFLIIIFSNDYYYFLLVEFTNAFFIKHIVLIGTESEWISNRITRQFNFYERHWR